MFEQSTHTSRFGLTQAWWLLAIIFSFGIYLSILLIPLLDPPQAAGYVFASFLLYSIYLLLAFSARKLGSGIWLWVLLLCGLLFRLLFVTTEPSMSDDMFRYVWDGHVQTFGINPYLYPPSSDSLLPLRNLSIHPFINHPQFHTVYPPVAQFLFWFSALLSPERVWGFKALMFLSESVTCLLLLSWLKQKGLPQGRVLFYAWCPLPILELGLDGHMDGFALPFLLAMLLFLQKKRPWFAGVYLAGAMLVKPLPLFMLPFICWKWRWIRSFRLLLSFTACCLLAYFSYVDAGPKLFTSLLHYSQHWFFNGALFKVLVEPLGNKSARLLLAGGVIFVSLWIAFSRRTWEEGLLVPFGAYLICAPTLYPWYLVWVAPWLVLRPQPWLFWFVGIVPLAHSVHVFYAASGVWGLPMWILAIEFLPLYLLMFGQFIYNHRTRKSRLSFVV